ncbi:hypothetical protein KEU06_09190 [Pseudaminobacter sp. 19-2017]|uniref:Uncharacterized protein n=1 Tax=Pseudaminobacter soli (ex Zhang et al. 2022) TaxID=2831468 RepID=A0A942DX30_9HYPH|nr:hypothetical protein [Pseudaminobacter soli]MBS3648778.1 hypothetical protein [Pseudaminobacter soli]
MNNMTLEAILEELCRYGLPSLHPFMADPYDRDQTKPTKPGLWDCHIQVPYNDASYELNPYRHGECSGTRAYARKFKQQVGFNGRGKTAREAAQQCLDRVLLYQEYGWHYLWPAEKKPAGVPDIAA